MYLFVKCCVFCLFVKLRLSLGHGGPGIKISRVIVARAKSMQRLDDVLQYQLCPLVVEKILTPAFYTFLSRSVPLFHSPMLTPVMVLWETEYFLTPNLLCSFTSVKLCPPVILLSLILKTKIFDSLSGHVLYYKIDLSNSESNCVVCIIRNQHMNRNSLPNDSLGPGA